jgi:hypothetical protein
MRMSVLLFVVGAIVAVAGVGMIGWGIPINEFSFGNTLIVAGTTATVGGLIVIGIGAMVGQLQRIAETLATRPPVRSSRPLDMYEQPADSRLAPGRIPFSSRPKSETSGSEPPLPMDAPAHAENTAQDYGSPHHASQDHAPAPPMLRNPDIAAAAAVAEYDIKEYEEVPLSPRHATSAAAHADLSEPAPFPPVSADASSEAEQQRPDPSYDAPWRSAPPPRPPQTSHFDAMWPADSRPARRLASEESKFEPKFEPKLDLPPAPALEAQRVEPPAAILKSGVVDGMGYTLYVDGSIEAELPNGTLRFASINELRDHLAKNS